MESGSIAWDRLDERIRRVENSQGKTDVRVDALREDIGELGKRIDNAARVGWGIIIALMSCALTVLGAFVVPH